MSLKRYVLSAATVLLALGWATSAQAAVQYSLVGGGGQWWIGGGLPLPIQPPLTVNGVQTAIGTNFPPLKIPPKLGTVISGTAINTANGGATRVQLTIPTAVLSKPAAQLTLGQAGENPTLYAVGTNLQFEWPGEPVIFNTTARTGAKNTTFSTTLKVTTGATPTATSGQVLNIKYSNTLPSKFGGPGRFRVTPGAAAGLMPQVPVTLYAIAVAGPGNPPCTHPALIGLGVPPLGGTFNNSLCLAAVGQALPTTTVPTPNANLGVIGGPVGGVMTTPGGTPNAIATTGTPNAPGSAVGPVPGVFVGAWDANGDFLTFGGGTNALAPTGGGMGGITNMATTVGFPWTTGQVKISAPAAGGAPEVFTLTGMDNRTVGGAGTIQLVGGGLSQRALTGDNANRAWIQLTLAKTTVVPSMSPTGFAAAAGLILLAAGYAARRRTR
jgi:hypothetical protein